MSIQHDAKQVLGSPEGRFGPMWRATPNGLKNGKPFEERGARAPLVSRGL